MSESLRMPWLEAAGEIIRMPWLEGGRKIVKRLALRAAPRKVCGL